MSKTKPKTKTGVRTSGGHRPQTSSKTGLKTTRKAQGKKTGTTYAKAEKAPSAEDVAKQQRSENRDRETEHALGDAVFIEYVSRNIGSHSNVVLQALRKGPMKDEALAEGLGIKLNEARRVLNLLNKHGVVRYNVRKDSSGWLTFEWHIDSESLADFYRSLRIKTESQAGSLPADCNDFFICQPCSKKQSVVYPFDIAYEKSFKCHCGKDLESISRTEAENCVKN